MNRPPKELKRLPAAQLRGFASACFKAAGLWPEHAEQLSELKQPN